MSFRLKNNEKLPVLTSETGSAMMIVLAFTSIAMITVFSFLLHQIISVKSSLRSPSSLQALFNARSGIYRAFYELIDSTATDTLPAISTLDSTFGSQMFLGISDSSSGKATKIQLNGEPVVYNLFPEEDFGECEVTAELVGGTCILCAIGRFRSAQRKVTAIIGSRPPAYPDTVILYSNTLPWDKKPFKGIAVSVGDTTFRINSSWFNKIKDRYLTEITDTDTFLLNTPLLIQNKNDLGKIDSVVNGALLIDGANFGITWKDNRKVIVKGDLQITGDVLIEGVDFIVAGEIKLLDKTKLLKSDIFTQTRLFIGDYARFEGNALALHSIAIYGKSNVTGKSTLVAGSTQASSSKSDVSDSLKFSIIISEEASVDAVCIAVGTPGSIKTDYQTQITGILWTQQLVCHRGKMAGLICAVRVVDCDDPLQMVSSSDLTKAKGGDSKRQQQKSGLLEHQLYNSIPGDVQPLEEIGLYSLPYFIGRLSIINMKEEYNASPKN